MQKKEAVILGGGISGLSAAWRLAQKGVPVQVLEAQAFPGGLAGTVRQGPYDLDFGPHSFFSDDDEILKTVLDLFDGKLREIPRSVKLYYRGRYLDYPFTPLELLSKMGIVSALETLASYAAARIKNQKPLGENEESVENWAERSFGRRLYLDFFKPYTEQFWKIPASELSARAIPSHTRTSFSQTLQSILKRKAGGGALIDREKLPTYYPRTGYGELAEKLAEKVRETGGELELSARVSRLCRVSQGWRVEYLQDGKEKEVFVKTVISTLTPLNLISMMQPRVFAEVEEAAAALEFRPIAVLGVITSRQNLLDCAYLYTLNRPYNRLTDMNRFSPETSPAGENILALEIPCSKEDWNTLGRPEEIFERCIPFLEQDGILKREEVLGLMMVKAPHAYPLYRKGYAKHLKAFMDFVKTQPGLSTLGRCGEFMYMDADRCIRRAFDLADRLAAEKAAS